MVFGIEFWRNGLFTKKENWYELMVDVTGQIDREWDLVEVPDRWKYSWKGKEFLWCKLSCTWQIEQ